MEFKEKIIKLIEQIDKFKLIDIISSVYYYYKISDEYDNMMSTVELEYLIDLIYKAKQIETRFPTKEDIMQIIELPNYLFNEDLKNSGKPQENAIFTQAKNNFLYEKEDTEYDSMIFEYLNLFKPVEHFFTTYYSFRIEDFLYFSKMIQLEYYNRMNLIKNTLKQSHSIITKDILIEYLLNCNCMILNFNEKTLSDNNININTVNSILKKFSSDEISVLNKGFENYPIFKKGDTYIVSSMVKLLYSAKTVFEKDLRKDIILGTFYAKMKGEYLEILTQNVIKDILKDSAIFSNVRYRENKHDRECDLLVIYDQIILIIEIKGRAFKEVSKIGSKSYLKQDLNDNIYKAYSQATRMENYLLKNNEVCIRFGKGNEKLTIKNTDKFKIFKLGITLENFRTYAVQYSEFNTDIDNDMLFFNINDLKFMSNYFKYQSEFIHYISQRIKANNYIDKFYMYDELYLFSEYKINNLQSILNNDHMIKIYDTGRYKLFDLRFNSEKKEQILKGSIHPLIDKIIKQMEMQKIPTYSFTIMNLLDLDYSNGQYIFENLKTARAKFIENGNPVHSYISFEKERDVNGLHIVLGISNKKNEKVTLEGIIILGSIFKRKNPDYDVIGLLNNIEDSEDNIVTCIKIMNPKPGFDEALDKIEELKNLF